MTVAILNCGQGCLLLISANGIMRAVNQYADNGTVHRV